MATRATYHFVDDDNLKTTVYIHWDGYQEGAANYFYQMLTNPSKGNLATQFIRANPNAEITSSHNAHADTEYQYNIIGNDGGATLVVKQKRKKKFVYNGKLFEFINQNPFIIENFKPIKMLLNEWFYATYLNSDMAQKLINEKQKYIENWKDKLHQGVRSANEQIEQLKKLFPELETQSI